MATQQIMLDFYSASTGIVDSRKAITECLENALIDQPDLNCDLIIIYAAMGHNFKELLSEARKLSPGARIAGCTCGGIIGRNGADESMRALAIMAIKGPKEEFAVTCGRKDAEDDPYDVVRKMALELNTLNPNINMIQFLPSPSHCQFFPMEKSLEGIKSVFGKHIPVFGGVASVSLNNLTEEDLAYKAFQFYDDEVIEDGAVMIGYADPTLKFVSHASHGFEVLEGITFEVTKSFESTVYEINHKPAWSVLTEILGLPEASHWADVLPLTGFARKIPEELWNENGSKFLISAVGVKNNDKSINLPFRCTTGMNLWLIKRNENMMFDGVDQMVRNILNELQGRKPLAVFHADCLMRGKYSLNRYLKDEIINRMQTPICKDENTAWLGFYGGGEFLMLGGESWFQMISSSLFALYR